MVVNMKNLKHMRRERVAMERQAATLFRALLKSERGRSGPSAHLTSPKEREAVARRVRVIESEILKIRRALRKIGGGR
jgi:hypothetical protein